MELATYFPIWKDLTPDQQDRVRHATDLFKAKKNTILHNGSADCLGLLVIRTGQLRVYYLSEDGREVTLYRLFERDICLFSASCAMRNIQFDVVIQTEKDSEMWVIPSCLYEQLIQESVAVSNYTNQLMASRFSEVMWLMEQIMWKSFDKRLASFLIEETLLEDSLSLKITHEKIANHLGTAREVVTRMLRYFQNEDMVKLTRGTVEITAPEKLEALRDM